MTVEILQRRDRVLEFVFRVSTRPMLAIGNMRWSPAINGTHIYFHELLRDYVLVYSTAESENVVMETFQS